MTASAPHAPHVASNSPLNFIYSCGICSITLSDVYKHRNETVKGLTDGFNPSDRLVTRMYLGKCSHVFCAEHLEGGAAPFHRIGERPQATCPVCLKRDKCKTPRELFSIRGFQMDEYDASIPSEYFKVPSFNMGSTEKDMDVLRFQYLALIRYCQDTYNSRKPTSDDLIDVQRQLEHMHTVAHEEREKVLSLRHENEALRTTLRSKQTQLDKVAALEAEIRRLKAFEKEVEGVRLEAQATRQLKVDLHDLAMFKQSKGAIKHYMNMLPILIEQNNKMKERLSSCGMMMYMEPIPNSPEISMAIFDEPREQKDFPGGRSGWFRTPSSTRADTMSDNLELMTPRHDRPLKRPRTETPIPPWRSQTLNPPSSREAMPPPPPPSKTVSRMTSVRKIIPNLRKKLAHARSMPSYNVASRPNDEDTSEGEQLKEPPSMQARHGKLPRYGTTDDGMKDTELSRDQCPIPHLGISEPRKSILLQNAGVTEGGSSFTFQAAPHAENEVEMSDHRTGLPTEPSYMNIMDGLSTESHLVMDLRDPRENNLQPFIPANGHVTPSSVAPTPKKFHRPGPRVDQIVSPFFRPSYPDAPGTPVTEPRDSHTRFNTFQSPQQVHRDSSMRSERISLNGLSFVDVPVNSRNEPIPQGLPERAWGHRDQRNFSDNLSSRSEANSYQNRPSQSSVMSFPSMASRRLSSAFTPITPGRSSARNQPQRQISEHQGFRSSSQTSASGRTLFHSGSQSSRPSSRFSFTNTLRSIRR